jgi:predicted ATP-binding protein involved in virulence
MDAPDPSVDDIAPLLQEKVDTRLNQLKQWVINTAIQSENAPNGREARMFETFSHVVRDVVPGRHVEFGRVDRQTWTVWLRTADGEVSFDSLSQGTSSILAWVGVLLQRLYGIYPHAEKPEEGAALVLIDEIDAHLHPRWQRKLVTLTREKFPNVQMIASSHSPLLAGAMRRTELRIVERDPITAQMRAESPREDLSGQKADDILTSSLFELPTSRSPQAEAKIKDYFALFEKYDRTPQENDKLRSLEEELDQLNYGPTLADRKQQQQIQSTLNAQLDAIPENLAASLSARLAGGAQAREGEQS